LTEQCLPPVPIAGDDKKSLQPLGWQVLPLQVKGPASALGFVTFGVPMSNIGSGPFVKGHSTHPNPTIHAAFGERICGQRNPQDINSLKLFEPESPTRELQTIPTHLDETLNWLVHMSDRQSEVIFSGAGCKERSIVDVAVDEVGAS
jgi:hypothetical protein